MARYVAVPMDPQAEPPPPPPAAQGADGLVAGPLEEMKEEVVDIEEGGGGSCEDEPLINQRYECRICQDDDAVDNLEAPCGCCGSLRYAHRKCIQHWCNEKGNTTCEICHQPYQPGYTAPLRPPPCDETAIDIHGRLTINGNPIVEFIDHRFMETEYVDYPQANIDSTGAELCRSVAFILMAILLLRHIFMGGDAEPDDEEESDLATFFGLFFLKVAAFLLPCYVMAWTVTLIARKREREAVAAATTPFALVLQSANAGDLHLTVATPPHLALPQEPQ